MESFERMFQRIKDQYFQQIPMTSFKWTMYETAEDYSLLTSSRMQEEIAKIVSPSKYCRIFLKTYLTFLELYTPEDTEVNEAILNAHIESLSCETNPPVVYTLGDYNVKINEDKNVLVKDGTTGLRTWEASMALAEYLYKHPVQSGSKIVELGAGTGLVSILCAKMGASVLATDGDERVCNDLQRNAELNDCKLTVERLTWGKDMIGYADAVIAADVTYEGDLSMLVRTIESAFDKNPQCKVILAATIRRQITFDRFLKLISHLKIQDVPQIDIPRLLYYDGPPVRIVVITRPNKTTI
ncbi:methyltransferase [Schizosaccharomyces japonicus yFS275]|uniref:Methyltransferase n=1 Tax=Schizosaccharomyces japonicus (strain yFS275 / FY16936) TaxID=402676 RepID=B6JY77_SCHJY|nr:methyltransferase [Schizosaccharomyces japonicus yFS275]EEB06495.2 methyltransferase [Schizosaccharomyces japonicus yFS275]